MSFFSGDVVAKEQLPGAVGSAMIAAPAGPAAPTEGDKWIGRAVLKRRLSQRQLNAIRSFFEAALNE